MSEHFQLETSDTKLVEGLSHEPEIVETARRIENGGISAGYRPGYKDLFDYTDIFYGVTPEQTEGALGIARARVRSNPPKVDTTE